MIKNLKRILTKKVKVTGVSTPLGGISLEQTLSDFEIAEKLITFLENRRILYSLYSSKCPKGVIESVIK